MTKDKHKHQRKPRKVKTTEQQRRGVNAIVSGQSKTLKDGMLSGGYSIHAARKPKTHFIERKGVQEYLKTLDAKAKKLWAMSLPDKVMEVYMDGLTAEKFVRGQREPIPDHMTRKAFADTFTRFFRWTGEAVAGAGRYTQFNFFSVSPEERGKFNQNFKRFLKYFYK